MISAIIVAAGRGTRMGPERDKLFLEVAGRPIIAHTWAQWDRFDGLDEIILVVREGLEPAFQELAATLGVAKPYRLTPGGRARASSVRPRLE